MKPDGAKTWVFADGYLPARSPDQSSLEAHEALMIVNTGSMPSHVKLDFYFSDQPPHKDVAITVDPERVICLRLDMPEQIGGLHIPPATQYALRVRSDQNVVVQFGRLDTTQANLAYYVNVGYCQPD